LENSKISKIDWSSTCSPFLKNSGNIPYEGPEKGKSPSNKLNTKGAGGAGQNQTFFFPRFPGNSFFGF